MNKKITIPEHEELFPFFKPISAERFIDLILPGLPQEEKSKLARQAEESAADKHKCTLKEAQFRSILNKIGRPGTEQMLKELKKLGFKRILIPSHNIKGLNPKQYKIELVPVRRVVEAVRELFG